MQGSDSKGSGLVALTSKISPCRDAPQQPIMKACANLLKTIQYQYSVLVSRAGTSQSTKVRHLQRLRFSNRQHQRVPYDLTPQQGQRRFDVCGQLLANSHHEIFLRSIVTGDERVVSLAVPQRRYPVVPARSGGGGGSPARPLRKAAFVGH